MRPEEMMEGIRHIEDAHVDAGAHPTCVHPGG